MFQDSHVRARTAIGRNVASLQVDFELRGQTARFLADAACGSARPSKITVNSASMISMGVSGALMRLQYDGPRFVSCGLADEVS